MLHSATGHLLSIQVGRVRPLKVGARKLVSAIGKTPVSAAVAVGLLGLDGDEQADLSVHGGLSKAVYALPSEHLPWWQARRHDQGVTMFDEPLTPGYLGENLSLQGLLEQDLFIGDCLHQADVVLRITQSRASPAANSMRSWAMPKRPKTWCKVGAAAFIWRWTGRACCKWACL